MNEQIDGTYLKRAKKLLELATTAKSQWISASPSERVSILNGICENHSLEGSTVRYSLKSPMRIIAEMKDMRADERWRPHGDSNPGPHRERVLS